MNKLSVIIPIYNAEAFLDNCIQSVKTQTYPNLEIILVNDGSTDNSAELCDKFACQDKRIKVIHQANGGQNVARKSGLDYATGEYVTFVDSDDWLEPDTYEKVFSAIDGQKFDLISFDYFMDRKTICQRVETLFKAGEYNRVEIILDIVPSMRWNFEKGRAALSPHLWNKLFRTEQIKKEFYKLDYNMTICEDAAIVYPYIMQSQKILITDICGYHYYQREDSVMHSFTAASFEKMERFQKYMQKELSRLGREYNDLTEECIKQVEEQFNQVIIRVVNNIIRDVYHINYNMTKWCPPYKKLPMGAKIALYGAGDVGQAYYMKFYGDPNYQIAVWVDRNYSKKNGISAPETLLSADYDIVLIAVDSESLAEQIKRCLTEMGVEEKKIIWDKPLPIRFSFT